MGNKQVLLDKTNFECVDLMKFIFCLCVIGIHTGIAECIPEASYFIDKLIFRLAVPYFFVASGFFLGRKMIGCSGAKEMMMVTKKYVFRLVKPYIVFEVINLVQAFLLMLRAGTSYANSVKQLVNHLLFAPYGALWYVWASLVAIILLYPFLVKKRINLALILGGVLYSWALFCNSYFFVAGELGLQNVVNKYMEVFLTARNGVFTGLFFMALGIKCVEIRCSEKWVTKHVLIATVVSFVAYCGEVCYVYYKNNSLDHAALYGLHIVLIPLLFLLTTNIKIPIKKKSAIYMRKLSVGMYFLHMPIQWFWDRLLNVSHISNNIVLSTLREFNLIGLLNFCIITFCSLFICIIVYKLKKEPFYSLLQ